MYKEGTRHERHAATDPFPNRKTDRIGLLQGIMKIPAIFILSGAMFLLFLVAPGPSLASSTGISVSGKAISLDSCIDLAMKRNLKLLQKAIEEKSASIHKKIAMKDLLPMLSTEYGYTGRRDANTISIFGRRTRISAHDNYEWRLTLSQPLFQGGTLWNLYKAAKFDKDISGILLRQAQNDLARQVKETYFTILENQALKDEAEAALRRLESHLEDAKEFYTAGLVSRTDLLQSKVELAQARENLIRIRHDLEISKEHLNLLVHMALDQPLVLTTRLRFEPLTSDISKLFDHALKNRPEINAARLAVQKAACMVKAAKGGYFPKVDLTASYIKQGITPDVSDNPFGDHDMAQVMITAKWELWSWGQTRDRIDISRLRLKRAKAALNDLIDTAKFEVRQAFLQVKDAEEKVRVARAALEHARENFELNRERYRQRIASSTDVLDAQALLTRSKSNYLAAITHHLIAKADLTYALGER